MTTTKNVHSRAAKVYLQLRELRIAQGLTMEEVAPLVGVHVNTLGVWERLERDPQLPNLLRWVDALGADLADLLTD